MPPTSTIRPYPRRASGSRRGTVGLAELRLLHLPACRPRHRLGEKRLRRTFVVGDPAAAERDHVVASAGAVRGVTTAATVSPSRSSRMPMRRRLDDHRCSPSTRSTSAGVSLRPRRSCPCSGRRCKSRPPRRRTPLVAGVEPAVAECAGRLMRSLQYPSITVGPAWTGAPVSPGGASTAQAGCCVQGRPAEPAFLGIAAPSRASTRKLPP